MFVLHPISLSHTKMSQEEILKNLKAEVMKFISNRNKIRCKNKASAIQLLNTLTEQLGPLDFDNEEDPEFYQKICDLLSMVSKIHITFIFIFKKKKSLQK